MYYNVCIVSTLERPITSDDMSTVLPNAAATVEVDIAREGFLDDPEQVIGWWSIGTLSFSMVALTAAAAAEKGIEGGVAVGGGGALSVGIVWALDKLISKLPS